MTVEGKDEFDVKQQTEVLNECMMMIPDSRLRLKEGVKELKSTIEEYKGIESVKDSEALKLAHEMLEEADVALVR